MTEIEQEPPSTYLYEGNESKGPGLCCGLHLHGEMNIYQEELNNFLDIGEDLELKGLTGGVGDSVEPGVNSREQTHDIDRDGNEQHIETIEDYGEGEFDDKIQH